MAAVERGKSGSAAAGARKRTTAGRNGARANGTPKLDGATAGVSELEQLLAALNAARDGDFHLPLEAIPAFVFGLCCEVPA